MSTAKDIFLEGDREKDMISVPAFSRFSTNDNFTVIGGYRATQMLQDLLARRQTEYFSEICEAGKCQEARRESCDGSCHAMKALRAMNGFISVPDMYMSNWLIPIVTYNIAEFIEGTICHGIINLTSIKSATRQPVYKWPNASA